MELFPNVSQDDEKSIYSFDCSVVNSSNDILIEIAKLDDADEGFYVVELINAAAPMIVGSSGSTVCVDDIYSIGDLPFNAIVTWTSSSNITIEESPDGLSVEIISFITNDPTDYFISAIIQTPDGCSTEVSKVFTKEDTGIINDFSVLEIQEPCYLPFLSPLINGLYQIIPLDNSNVTYSIGVSNVSATLNNLIIWVNPTSNGDFYFEVVAIDECDNRTVWPISGYAEPCTFGDTWGFTMSPNPASNTVNVQIMQEQGQLNSMQSYTITVVEQITSQVKENRQVTSGGLTLDLSGYTNGVYVVTIQRGTQVVQNLLVVAN